MILDKTYLSDIDIKNLMFWTNLLSKLLKVGLSCEQLGSYMYGIYTYV